MKDTKITAQTKKRELIVILSCFAAANIINAASILYYGTRWIEMLSQIGFTLCITALLYLLTWGVRLASRLFCCKK